MNSWNEYPTWVQELKLFLDDTIIDYIANDGSDDEITDKIKDFAMMVVCAEYGHMVEDDQCMIPGHRYCGICGKRMANISVGHYKPEETQ